jgi:hypothetical protein
MPAPGRVKLFIIDCSFPFIKLLVGWGEKKETSLVFLVCKSFEKM